MSSSYEVSTQFHSWRFSPEQLDLTRHTLNSAAIAAIKGTFEKEEPGSAANVSFLTAQEELLLVKLYITKIPQLCGHFRFPEEVEATAITYLKRFYLRNTVMDWHPKNVMLTALFLATKTTNHPISLEAYTSNIPRTTSSDVLDLEFLIAQSLSFEFAVWHAHRALWGLWLDLQSTSAITEDHRSRDVYEIALKHVRNSRFTDAELIYAPSQIALAALSLASPFLAQKWLDFKSSGLSESPSETHESIVNAVKALITHAGHLPEVEAVREVDRRLKLCKNPEKVVGTKAYLARKAEEEHQAEVKRNKKAQDMHRSLESDDPFSDTFGERQRPQGDDDDDDDD